IVVRVSVRERSRREVHRAFLEGDRRSFRLRRSEEHTSELQSLTNLVCRLLLEKKKQVVLPVDRALTGNAELVMSTAARQVGRAGVCSNRQPAVDNAIPVHTPRAPPSAELFTRP